MIAFRHSELYFFIHHLPSRFMKQLLLIAAMLMACICPSPAQTHASAPVDSTAVSPGTDWQVSLLTCAPGEIFYELEGHAGLRIRSVSRGVDEVVHWGIFDFNSPGFVWRYVKGDMRYLAGAVPTDYFFHEYEHEGRAVTEQVLNLTSEQAEKVVALVAENLKPENRVYAYNYVTDNCSTRPLSVIERAVGDTVALGAPGGAMAGVKSFRDAMRVYHRNYPWYQFGIDICLGSTIDREESQRAMAFAPVALSQMASAATLPDGSPLVADTVMFVDGDTAGLVSGPTPWYLTPMFWSIAVLILTIAVTFYDIAAGRLSRGFDVVMYTVFGLAGCLVTFLWFFSAHTASSPNWLLLWLNPLCLLPLLMVWTKGSRRLLMWWQIINFVALIGLCVVFVVGIQAYNGAFIPLIVSDMVRSLFFIFYVRCFNPSSRVRQPLLYRR